MILPDLFFAVDPQAVPAMGEDSDLPVLIERIGCLGRLPEHLLWEAAKSMTLDRSSSPGRRFARLAEAGAMLEAAVLLVGLQPCRSVASIAIRGRRWICVIGRRPPTGRGSVRSYRAIHIDPAAAVLMALLSSHLDSPRTDGVANAAAPEMQREFEHHDI